MGFAVLNPSYSLLAGMTTKNRSIKATFSYPIPANKSIPVVPEPFQKTWIRPEIILVPRITRVDFKGVCAKVITRKDGSIIYLRVHISDSAYYVLSSEFSIPKSGRNSIINHLADWWQSFLFWCTRIGLHATRAY